MPNGYTGPIDLVLSKASDNVFTVDSNGIGYLNEWTFNKVYTKPEVIQVDGKRLDKNAVGFNSSSFFGIGSSVLGDGQELQSLSFEVVPDSAVGQKQHYFRDLTELVDRNLTLLSKPDGHTTIQTKMIDSNTFER